MFFNREGNEVEKGKLENALESRNVRAWHMPVKLKS